MERSRATGSSVWILGVLAIACGPLLPPISTPTAERPSSRWPIVALGDTQRTSWPERLTFREQNESERRLVVAMVASENPAFVLHLGDMVTFGSSEADWAYFDRLMMPLGDVPLLPVLGNHEYLLGGREGLANAARRFPWFDDRTFYSVRIDDVVMLFVDSNLEGERWRSQRRWFLQRIRAADHDRRVRGVLVLVHHPPYSMAPRVSLNVRRDLVPPFLAADKTLAMISGHAHGYERFEIEGRAFVVSGGGGGPRVSYDQPGPEDPPPAYDGVAAKRPFNYLLIDRTAAGLSVVVRCLGQRDGCRGGRLDAFSLPWQHGRQ